MIAPNYQDFNFQSGFGNLNDISDSIGSLFGFGPEDRDSVTARTVQSIQSFTNQVISSIPTTGIDGAITVLQNKITETIAHQKKMKSSNSKHVDQLWIDTLPKVIAKLNIQKNQSPIENAFDTVKETVGSIEPQKASVGYFAMFAIILFMFSNKKIKY
jgi:hypothetical protein